MRSIPRLGIWFCLLGWGCSTAAPVPEERDRAPVRSEVEHGPVRVVVEVGPQPIRLSDQPQLRLTIEHERGVMVERPDLGTTLGDFWIREARETLPELDGSRQVLHQVLTLEPQRAGELRIDPVVVTFTDQRPQGDGGPQQVETQPLTVHVSTSVSTDAPSLTRLKDAQDPVPLPRSLSGWWMGGAMLAIGMAAIAGYFLLRRRQAALTPPPTPRELAARELDGLWGSQLAQRDVKQFYVELTGIVRRYIERTTSIRAPEQTTEEFLVAISWFSDFTNYERQRLKDFLESADLVKFAAVEPEFGDIEESFRRAKIFVGIRPAEGQQA